MNKLDRKTTALIKDLELQLDYLIGYAPASNHWKHEYHIRKALLDNSRLDAPSEIVDKINRIEDSLYRLRNKTKHNQDYITYSQIDYIITRKIKVNNGITGETYYI